MFCNDSSLIAIDKSRVSNAPKYVLFRVRMACKIHKRIKILVVDDPKSILEVVVARGVHSTLCLRITCVHDPF